MKHLITQTLTLLESYKKKKEKGSCVHKLIQKQKVALV